MEYTALLGVVQRHFTDGLVVVVGSGLSVAEGIPGMPALARHLEAASGVLVGSDAATWKAIAVMLAAGDGLEAALLRHQPSPSLESWIARETAALIVPREREVIAEVVGGHRTLRLTRLLQHVLEQPSGLPILTPNYDRLVEVACEMAGFHVDTTACGLYAGAFDHRKSAMASCRGLRQVRKTAVLDHQRRAVVLKPHGSLDWYRRGTEVIRCSMDLGAERAIITPGLNKYKAGYESPFDKHRELANEHVNRAARFLVIGYGFNDDHLQNHLVQKIKAGTPTLILTRGTNPTMDLLARDSPSCICVSRATSGQGIVVASRGEQDEHQAAELWDIGVLATEVLE